jgi:hypothetical protein
VAELSNVSFVIVPQLEAGVSQLRRVTPEVCI